MQLWAHIYNLEIRINKCNGSRLTYVSKLSFFGATAGEFLAPLPFTVGGVPLALLSGG